MERTKVESSNINEIGYDPDSETLHIEFKSGDVYEYTEISQDQADALMNAESKGKYFNQHIRHNHKGRKLPK